VYRELDVSHILAPDDNAHLLASRDAQFVRFVDAALSG